MRNPFDSQRPCLLSWNGEGRLREALIAVPVAGNAAVPCRVIVPAGAGPADWLQQAAVAAIVTVSAVRARLLAEAADQTTD